MGWLEETGLADLLGLVPGVGLIPRTVRSLTVASRLARLGEEGGPKVKLPKSLEDIKLDPKVQYSAQVLAQRFNAEPSRVRTGKGLRFNAKDENGKDKVSVRVMNAGSGEREKPYYRITLRDKAPIDRWGSLTDHDALNHIDIDSISVEEVIGLIERTLKWKGK